MSAVRSNVFLMSAATWKPGYCWLCAEARLLKFRDASTGQCVCGECVGFVLVADRALHQTDGLRPPTHDESTNLPNSRI